MSDTLFVCAGGAHVDRKCRAIVKTDSFKSVPVHTTVHLGGVARNIAENLARLGGNACLLSRVGSDSEGDWVLQRCKDIGINTSFIERSNSRPTACYTALMSCEGEVLVGLADMEVYDEMSPDAIDALVSIQEPSVIWIIDANLPACFLQHLFSKLPEHVQVCVSATSEAKAPKLRDFLPRINYLFADLAEGRAICGDSGESNNAFDIASALFDLGVRHVVVSLSEQGALLHSESVSTHFPASAVGVVDTIGAGDSLLAGFIYALAHGIPLDAAMLFGQRLAAHTITSMQSVNPSISALSLLLEHSVRKDV